jgi:DNA-binding transcriptional LysR family regulator
MLFVVAPTHPLAHATGPLTETDIAAHRGIVAADTSRRLAPRSIGILTGQDTLTVPDLDAKLAAQVAGLGCGFLPASVAAPDIAAGRLVIKAIDTPRLPARVSAAWKTARPGHALGWWIEAIGRADWRFLALAPVATAPAPAGKGNKRSRRRA